MPGQAEQPARRIRAAQAPAQRVLSWRPWFQGAGCASQGGKARAEPPAGISHAPGPQRLYRTADRDSQGRCRTAGGRRLSFLSFSFPPSYTHRHRCEVARAPSGSAAGGHFPPSEFVWRILKIDSRRTNRPRAAHADSYLRHAWDRAS